MKTAVSRMEMAPCPLSETHVESFVARLTSDICWNELEGTTKLAACFNSRT
jgi:hypothetical protein